MNIYNVILVLDEDDTMTSLAFPCSSYQIAEELMQECEKEFDNLVGGAIVESQLDAGLNAPQPIH